MQIETPCFVIDKDKLSTNFQGIRSAFHEAWGENVRIGYSVKTNSLPWLVGYALSIGFDAEVVSDYEYGLARRMGFDVNQIIFNGPIKGKTAFLEVLKGGGLVNIDSKRELQWLDDLDPEQCYRVGLRVNLNLNRLCKGESRTGDDGSRFGFSEDDGELAEAIECIRSYHNVELVGLHLHVNSKSRSPEVYAAIARYACDLQSKYCLELSYIDMGGGFFGGVPNLGCYVDYARAISSILKRSFSPDDTTLIIEPGGSILATPIDFMASVVDTKTINGKRFVITEASRVWLDPTMSKHSHRYEVFTSSTTHSTRQVICGYTCMDTDRLMELDDELELHEGDKIVFKMVGAYTYCFSPAFFIEPRPCYYVVDKGVATLVKERDTLDVIIGGPVE